MTPMGRNAQPEKIAAAFVFLASPQPSSDITCRRSVRVLAARPLALRRCGER